MFDIFWDLGRLFGSFLDTVIYGLIPVIYKLFIYLSEINLFSMNDDSPLSALVGRIYVFLGIFMLFKVTFSLIQYLIDPSSFTDKSKGFGKLVTNAMVTILLLVSVPYIFNYAMVLQNTIVTSNAIGTLVMGNNYGRVVANTTIQKDRYGNDVVVSSGLSTEKVEEMAKDVQFLMYGAFFSINPTAEINETGGGNQKNTCADTPIFGTVEMAKTGDQKGQCLGDLKAEFEDKSTPMNTSGTKLTDFFKTSETGTEGDVQDNRNFANFSNLLTWRDSNGEYVINYLPFISAAAGLYVVFLLISFSVDIAVRAIKLCFLEMVAPIAIVSYIDPKESMSNSKLKNWIKESLTTYFSLFLRIATLFLVMVLISAIASSVFGENGYISQQAGETGGLYPIMIYLFLVIGAFMFAKKVPQMIESIFGIKLSGELNLNPFKNPALAAATGLALGGTAGLMAGARAGAEAGAPLRGALAGLMGGARNGFSNKGSKNLFGTTRNQLYKQLTGNEMKVFNPYQKLMGIGGAQKVEDINQYVNEARAQLNEAHSDLNRTSNFSAQTANELMKKGVNINNLKEEKEKRQASIQSSTQLVTSYTQQLATLQSTIESATAPGSNVSKEKLQELTNQEKELQGKLAKHNTTITQNKGMLSTINTYENSIARENELRAEIGKIENDIKTLSDEKSQRKQFYGIDTSTKQDVGSAISHVKDRRN